MQDPRAANPNDPPAPPAPLAGLDAAGLLGAAATPGAADPALAALQPLFPTYRILERIGRGATSSVYRARHRKLDRTVAIKILDPEIGGDAGFRERFEREARATARLLHPFIVTILDFGDVEGVLYLVLEDCGGRTLRSLLATGESGRRTALTALARTAEALAYAHGQFAVHRDLKPENVLVDPHGYPRVADFGLARIVEPGTPRLTRTGDVMGTPHYMAPEQVQGREVDARADVYALGVMAYEAIAGHLPIGRFDAPGAVRIGHPELDALVMAALSTDPTARPPLGELQRALEAAGCGNDGPVPRAASRVDPVAPVAKAAGAAVGAAMPHRAGDPKPATAIATSRAQLALGTSGPRTLQAIGAGAALVAALMPWVHVQLGSMGAMAASGIDGTWKLFGIVPLPGWLAFVATAATLATLVVARLRPLRVPVWMSPTMAGIGVLWSVPPLLTGLGRQTVRASADSPFAPNMLQGFDSLLSAKPDIGAFLATLAFVILAVGWFLERRERNTQRGPQDRARAIRLAALRRARNERLSS